MQNVTIVDLHPIARDSKYIQYKLAPNEFSDKNQFIGLFSGVDRLLNFFTVEGKESTQVDGYIGVYIDFKLASIQRLHRRKFYTLFELLGDFGGFNEAVFLLPKIFMVAYAQAIYQSTIFSEIP